MGAVWLCARTNCHCAGGDWRKGRVKASFRRSVGCDAPRQPSRHLVGKASACTSIHRHCQRRQRRVISRDNMENFSGQSRTHSDQRGNSMTIGKPFQKGRSGNPGGRPKVVAEVKELARKHTGKAIETLVSIMDNPKAAPAARVSAANALLDRGYGKPPQHITGEGGPSYVVRLPEPAKNAEEWLATVNKPMLVSQPLADDGHVSDNQLNTNDNDEDSTS